MPAMNAKQWVQTQSQMNQMSLSMLWIGYFFFAADDESDVAAAADDDDVADANVADVVQSDEFSSVPCITSFEHGMPKDQ